MLARILVVDDNEVNVELLVVMLASEHYVVSTAFAPAEANPPLVVDADAVLPLTPALQRFKPIAWWHGHLPHFRAGMQRQQFASRTALDGRRKPA